MFSGVSQYMFLFIQGATVGQNNHDGLPGENVNPNLINSSLNLSAFRENLPNLSSQINSVSLGSLFGMFQGPLEAPQS